MSELDSLHLGLFLLSFGLLLLWLQERKYYKEFRDKYFAEMKEKNKYFMKYIDLKNDLNRVVVWDRQRNKDE